jgi:hypothetical protein
MMEMEQLQKWNWRLWRWWVLANTIGEVIGIGAATAIGVALARIIETTMGAFAGLAMAGVMIAVGTFEGVVVGVAQWLVLRRPIPNMSRRAWLFATAIGAFVAWTLGMIPSTVMSMSSAPSASSPPFEEMSGVVMWGLAAVMGLGLGPILGIPQWLVLRRYVQKAGWWIPANAGAWALGMPIIFIGAGLVPADGFSAAVVVIGLATGAAAGAVVGAVHGLALIWLLRTMDFHPSHLVHPFFNRFPFFTSLKACRRRHRTIFVHLAGVLPIPSPRFDESVAACRASTPA